MVELEGETGSRHTRFWVLWSLAVCVIVLALYSATRGPVGAEAGQAASAALSPIDAVARGQFGGVYEGLLGVARGAIRVFTG